MTTRKPPFGTAMQDVLVKLTSPYRRGASWKRSSGETLYIAPALDEELCRGLAALGYLDETFTDGSAIYRVNDAGKSKAEELRIYR